MQVLKIKQVEENEEEGGQRQGEEVIKYQE